MRRAGSRATLMLGLALALPASLAAQKLGKGGTGVDENTELPRCDAPAGVVALVEEKQADVTQGMSPGLQSLMRMAEAQNGESTARVDPLLLIKLMAARSSCFRVADRGGAFTALERERAMQGANVAKPLTKADYLISAQVLYTDAKSRESGGGLGGVFGGAVGLKSKTLESQVLLSLVNVDTGIQEAVASGAARKKDLGIVGGGLLLGLGVGALGGTYASTDIGKITSLAVLDAFRKLVNDARPRLEALQRQGPALPQAQPLAAPVTAQPVPKPQT